MNNENNEITEVRRITCIGMAINVAISILKAIGGIFWHSQALFADAIHSISDLATDLAVILGVKFWSAPADEEHPYGHGKIQALVTSFIAAALLLVAWRLASDAALSIYRGEYAKPSIPALGVALISIASKEWLFRATRRIARAVNSPAVEANAWHHRSDAISSIPVAISIAIAYFFPALAWVDSVGALLVSLFIAKIAWEISRPALEELVDADNEKKSEEVKRIASKVEGVISVHKIRTRRYGGTFNADLHIKVAPGLTIANAHTIGHNVKYAVLDAGINVTDVIVHAEPDDVKVVVSLGSNIEPRAEFLEKARTELAALPCTHLVKEGSVAETEPVDVPEQYKDLKFLNQLVVMETELDPFDFSARIHSIEDKLGRVRKEKNAPRTIDLDIISFGDMKIDTPELTVPHPRAKERAFITDALKELGIELK